MELVAAIKTGIASRKVCRGRAFEDQMHPDAKFYSGIYAPRECSGLTSASRMNAQGLSRSRARGLSLEEWLPRNDYKIETFGHWP